MRDYNVLEIINKMIENTRVCSLEYQVVNMKKYIYNSIDK